MNVRASRTGSQGLRCIEFVDERFGRFKAGFKTSAICCEGLRVEKFSAIWADPAERNPSGPGLRPTDTQRVEMRFFSRCIEPDGIDVTHHPEAEEMSDLEPDACLNRMQDRAAR